MDLGGDTDLQPVDLSEPKYHDGFIANRQERRRLWSIVAVCVVGLLLFLWFWSSSSHQSTAAAVGETEKCRPSGPFAWPAVTLAHATNGNRVQLVLRAEDGLMCGLTARVLLHSARHRIVYDMGAGDASTPAVASVLVPAAGHYSVSVSVYGMSGVHASSYPDCIRDSWTFPAAVEVQGVVEELPRGQAYWESSLDGTDWSVRQAGLPSVPSEVTRYVALADRWVLFAGDENMQEMAGLLYMQLGCRYHWRDKGKSKWAYPGRLFDSANESHVNYVGCAQPGRISFVWAGSDLRADSMDSFSMEAVADRIANMAGENEARPDVIVIDPVSIFVRRFDKHEGPVDVVAIRQEYKEHVKRLVAHLRRHVGTQDSQLIVREAGMSVGFSVCSGVHNDLRLALNAATHELARPLRLVVIQHYGITEASVQRAGFRPGLGRDLCSDIVEVTLNSYRQDMSSHAIIPSRHASPACLGSVDALLGAMAQTKAVVHTAGVSDGRLTSIRASEYQFWYHWHVHKAIGTSFCAALRTHNMPAYWHASCNVFKWELNLVNNNWYKKEDHDHDFEMAYMWRFRMMASENNIPERWFPKAGVLYSIMVREPVSRLLSHLAYHMHVSLERGTVDQDVDTVAVQTQRLETELQNAPNFLTLFMCANRDDLECAKANMRRMGLILVFSDRERTARLMGDVYGTPLPRTNSLEQRYIPKVKQKVKKLQLTDEQLQRVRGFMANDLELYRYALELVATGKYG